MRIRIIVLCLWTCVYAALVVFQVRDHRIEEQSYIDNQIERMTLRIESTAQNLENFSAYTLRELVEAGDLAYILAQVQDASVSERDALRGTMYALLYPTYHRMVTFDFPLLHVHLPDLTSFLRMHAPEKNGDYLGDVRHTVRIANEERRVVRGFEEGRVFNGYRFVYPITYEGTHVGTIEVASSMASFLRVLSQITASQYLFAMERETVERVMFADEQNKYYDSYLAPSLLFDRTVIPAGNDTAHEEFFAERREELESKLETSSDFGFFGELDGIESLIVFNSLRNIEGRHVGYIVSIEEDNTQQRMWVVLLRALVLLTLEVILIQILSWVALTERRRLKQLAGTDQLTGVLNRHSFEEALRIEMEKAARYDTTFGLLMLDIDHFKIFNDNHGHNEGDRALRGTAQWIHGNIRSSDIVARWGGEEFVVAVNQCTCETAQKVAEKICRGLEAAPISNARQVTVSVGVAMYRKGDSLESLVGRADRALYEAKANGRDRVELDSSEAPAPSRDDDPGGGCL